MDDVIVLHNIILNLFLCGYETSHRYTFVQKQGDSLLKGYEMSVWQRGDLTNCVNARMNQLHLKIPDVEINRLNERRRSLC